MFFAALGDDGIGSEQNGTRPVVVIQNNIGNRFAPTVIVACATSRMGKTELPTHVICEIAGEQSLILCEQIKTIDKSRLINKVSSLPSPILDRLDRAIRISLGV